MSAATASVALPRPSRKGIDVKPQAVRAARLEAGLTLAAVAGTELSRAAIHLIESGRARPSQRTLELIAQRTGKPVAWFLSDSPTARPAAAQEALVAELERLAATEDFEAVIRAGGSALDEYLAPPMEIAVRIILGEACVAQAEPHSAQTHLRTARDLLQSAPDRLLQAECMDWEAKALHQMEDPGAASLFEEALRICRSLVPVPAMLEARILGHIGALHASTHDWSQAITSYEDAVRAATVVKDLGQLAKMYNDLCFAYEELGDYVRASAYSQRALALTEISRDRKAMARLQNNLGRILLRQGKKDPAKRALDESLRLCEDLDLHSGKSHVLLSLAEYEAAWGDNVAARRYISEAISLSGSMGEKVTLAAAQEAMAEHLESQGDTQGADRYFADAISALEELGSRQRLIESHRAYSELLERRGDALQALSHAKRALELSRHGSAADSAGPARAARGGA